MTRDREIGRVHWVHSLLPLLSTTGIASSLSGRPSRCSLARIATIVATSTATSSAFARSTPKSSRLARTLQPFAIALTNAEGSERTDFQRRMKPSTNNIVGSTRAFSHQRGPQGQMTQDEPKTRSWTRLSQDGRQPMIQSIPHSSLPKSTLHQMLQSVNIRLRTRGRADHPVSRVTYQLLRRNIV